MPDRAGLRDRLLELRRDALHMLETGTIDSGMLTIVAATTIVLKASAQAAAAGDADQAEAGSRVVLSDDAEELRVTVYGDEGALATVTVTPSVALHLARDLLTAAAIRMRRERVLSDAETRQLHQP